MRERMLLPAIVLALVVSAWVGAQQRGESTGKVITVGEDRVVVAVEGRGQMTFEVRTVPDGDNRIKDSAQVAQVKALRPEQTVEVKWGQSHDGHYFIEELKVAGQEPATHGLVSGTVITSAGNRLVLADDEGGQVTLEAINIRRRNQFMRDPFQVLAISALEPDDRVLAMWQFGEGNHRVLRAISGLDTENQALALVLTQAQLRESYNQINQLQNQINQLQNQIGKLIQRLDGQG